MENKILRGYSILGSASYDDYYNSHGATQSALVAVKSIPYTRVFLGVGRGQNEDEIYNTVARLGDEITFEWLERLYLMMKEERENGSRDI